MTRASGIGRLVFTRQVTRTQYVLGKILELRSGSWPLSSPDAAWSALRRAARSSTATLAAADLVRLALFYGLSWLYLMVFVLIGMLHGAAHPPHVPSPCCPPSASGSSSPSSLPQFTSGLRPTQSLNPITDPVSTSQTFFRVTAHRPSDSRRRAVQGRRRERILEHRDPTEPPPPTTALSIAAHRRRRVVALALARRSAHPAPRLLQERQR